MINILGVFEIPFFRLHFTDYSIGILSNRRKRFLKSLNEIYILIKELYLYKMLYV